jgi:hypothetical protein
MTFLASGHALIGRWRMLRPARSPRLLKGGALVAALLLTWSSIALAAPGTIKRGTDARTAPFNVAPIVEEVPAGTKVDADNAASNGWRRVQLPSGKYAFVRDEDVAVDLSQVPPPSPAPPAHAATAVASAETPGPAAPAPVEPLEAPSAGRRAPIYVGDFSHLAELVRSDPKAYDLATTYSAEQHVSTISIWGGVFGGLLLWVLADTALKHHDCVNGLCADSTNSTVRNIGTVLLVLGPLVGWAVRPTRDDQTRVIDEWNFRHPDRPFIDHAGVEAPQ